MKKEDYMKAALNEAVKGLGFTNPNPMVGAVIVKDGRIISRGYHRRYGELHAERNAINNCKDNLNGSEIYVTLEPCCHYGKTPPCTEAIIQSGIKKVFIGSEDPNPLVAGKGAETLRKHGIYVESGILKKECDRINDVFFHYITYKTPFVVMKYAMTADGKIACYNGESKWITGERARENVQKSRLRYSAVMVGAGTVIADDPMLTCRLENGRNPIRIICDSRLRIPADCNIVKTADKVRTIIACLETAKNAEIYQKYGVEILRTGERDGRVDLKELVVRLGEMKIDSILLEGGGRLAEGALKAGIVDKVQFYIAPMLIGGESAKTPVEGRGIAALSEAWHISNWKAEVIGDDIKITGYIKERG